MKRFDLVKNIFIGGMITYGSFVFAMEHDNNMRCYLVECSDGISSVAAPFFEELKSKSKVVSDLYSNQLFDQLVIADEEIDLHLPGVAQKQLITLQKFYNASKQNEEFIKKVSNKKLIELYTVMDYVEWRPSEIDAISLELGSRLCNTEMIKNFVEKKSSFDGNFADIPFHGTGCPIALPLVNKYIKPFLFQKISYDGQKTLVKDYPSSLLCFSGNAQRFMKGVWNSKVIVCDRNTKRELYQCDHGRAITAGALNYDGSRALTSVNPQTGRAEIKFWHKNDVIHSIQFGKLTKGLCLNALGDRAAIGTENRILVVDVDSKKNISSFHDRENITALALNGAGTLLASASCKSIRIWDPITKSLLHRLNIGAINSCVFCPDDFDGYMVARVDAGKLYLIDIPAGATICIEQKEGLNGPLVMTQEHIVAQMYDASIKSWHIDDPRDRDCIGQWDIRKLMKQLQSFTLLSAQQALYVAALCIGLSAPEHLYFDSLPKQIRFLIRKPSGKHCIVS